ncbi:MAG: hypothetical protein ACE5G8_06825 [Anaerolineae bacterium]
MTRFLRPAASKRLTTILASVVIIAALIGLVQALSALHKYDLEMYQHNARVFLSGGDLYADPRNFIPPAAMVWLVPLAWAGGYVKQLQVIVTLAAVWGAVTFFSRLWGGKEKSAPVAAAILLSFPFIDTMSQGHLGGWTLAGYALAFAAIRSNGGWRQAAAATAAFSLVLLKPQGGLFVALSLLVVLPWTSRLAMLAFYALQWGWVTATTGGVFAVTARWLVQLAGHANKYPNLFHDVSPKSIIRNFAGVEWQFLAYGIGVLVAALWVGLLWAWFKKRISTQTLLVASIPLGYWFSPYFSNYDLLPIAAVLLTWLAITHPRLALGFYGLHAAHWLFILINDYGPGIVQAAPGWILFTALVVWLKIRADGELPGRPPRPPRNDNAGKKAHYAPETPV